MRTVGELPHPRMKITLFHHNGKFTAQFEERDINIRFTSRESDQITTVEEFSALLSEDVISKIEAKLLGLQKYWIELNNLSQDEFIFDTII
jgi:hypothetical protein